MPLKFLNLNVAAACLVQGSILYTKSRHQLQHKWIQQAEFYHELFQFWCNLCQKSFKGLTPGPSHRPSLLPFNYTNHRALWYQQTDAPLKHTWLSWIVERRFTCLARLKTPLEQGLFQILDGNGILLGKEFHLRKGNYTWIYWKFFSGVFKLLVNF